MSLHILAKAEKKSSKIEARKNKKLEVVQRRKNEKCCMEMKRSSDLDVEFGCLHYIIERVKVTHS